MSVVLVPGSFDPIHLGHLDVISTATRLFGSVVVAVMHNPSKPSGLFTVDERVDLAARSASHLADIRVQVFEGLAVQAAERAGADFIVKGVRTPADFDIEQQMAHNNQQLTGISTVYVPCRPDLGYISSRFIREIAANGMAVDHLVPAPVADALASRFRGV